MGVMVFSATFHNISVVSWRSVLLVVETGVPGENHRPAASHWSTLSHKVVLNTPHHERNSNSQLSWWYTLIAQVVINPTTIRSRPWPGHMFNIHDNVVCLQHLFTTMTHWNIKSICSIGVCPHLSILKFMIYEYYRTLFEALCMLAYSLFWRGNRSISVKINNLFVFDYFFQHILIGYA